jgi:hypothetical protein
VERKKRIKSGTGLASKALALAQMRPSVKSTKNRKSIGRKEMNMLGKTFREKELS